MSIYFKKDQASAVQPINVFVHDPKYRVASTQAGPWSNPTAVLDICEDSYDNAVTLFLTPHSAYELECALRDFRRGIDVNKSDYVQPNEKAKMLVCTRGR